MEIAALSYHAALGRDRRAFFNPKARAAATARMATRLASETALFPLVTQRRVLLAVAAEFGLDVERLTGPRRFEELVQVRCAFALIARRRLGAPFERIARTMRRDHSCAANAWEKGARLESNNPLFAGRVGRIEARVWPPIKPKAIN
jgi:chromosomal replication initiation ATPase DnaA